MLGALDWTIIALYLIGMLGLGFWLGKEHVSSDDYYVAGRKMSWWSLGISTMATQSSANSFIGIPAFVALASGGGLGWLQYELAVPLAMIFLMIFIVPILRNLKLVSAYEYLEKRFGLKARLFISAVFLISRGVGTAAGLYAAAIVISVALNISITFAVLLLGVVTVVYDTLGGMKGVVISDVIQMGILLGGLAACILFIQFHLSEHGYTLLQSLPPERFKALDFSWGLGDNSNVPFWAFLLGGFFLYASYYGVDQSQVQRTLSAKSGDEAKKVLFFNGIFRFPLTLCYLLLGIASAGIYAITPSLQEAVTTPNHLVPEVIKMVLPVGLKGMLLAALLAAAMSSLDSALNSLSAVTMTDFVNRYFPLQQARNKLLISKLVTLLWGGFIICFALLVDRDTPVVVTINKIGSAFYGPLLAAFTLGILTRKTTETSLILGVSAGVVANLCLWLFNINIHWMWWNLWGFVLTILTSEIINLFITTPQTNHSEMVTINLKSYLKNQKGWYKYYLLLFGYFLFMIAVGFGINYLGK